MFLKQVQGSRESFVFVLSGRDRRAKRISGQRRMLERRQATEWGVTWDLEVRWRREPWTKVRTPLLPGGRAGMDAARLSLMLGSCGHFQVMTSVLFVMQEVGSSVSERNSHQAGSPSLRPSHPWASVTTPSASLPDFALCSCLSATPVGSSSSDSSSYVYIPQNSGQT